MAARYMDEALALGEAVRGTTAPNPNVGCVIVARDAKGVGKVIGRGATAAGGRPHAEAIALAEAGEAARGATLYTTLEPCAHESVRGPACSDLIVEAGVARVVAALRDPDPRTDGSGFARLKAAGVKVTISRSAADRAARSMQGFFTRLRLGRPFVTLKLALSIDGRIALQSGESKWITGVEARQDVHMERAKADMILVGRGTLREDDPSLDVRLPGLEHRSPRRAVLTTGAPVDGWTTLKRPEAIIDLADVNDLLVEGGSGAATAFLRADLVDRMLIYRAPILIGEGKSAVGYVGLDQLADAHGRWTLVSEKRLGADRLEVYERLR